MSSANLVSQERCKLAVPMVASSDDRKIDLLIASCSEAIQKYCRRQFALAGYDELYDGWSGDRLLLREYPVQSVEAVRYGPRAVLEVTNSDTATNQQARVTVTATGLALLRVASGVRALVTSPTWASYPTLQGLAAAVSALGSGWSARAVGSATGDYGLWPSADLYVPPRLGDGARSEGALDCRGRWAALRLHVGELAEYGWDVGGWLYRRPGAWGEWAPADESPAGPGYWRVQYTAGYAEVPDPVQEACAEWVSELYHVTKRDPAVSQQFGGDGGTTFSPLDPGRPPRRVAALLAPYRRHVV